jgi:hypothetical protein
MERQRLFWAAVALVLACLHGTSRAQPPTKGLAEGRFENESVRITVKVHSGVYTYEVTNLGNSPIVDFKIATPAAFAIIVPDGWKKEITGEFLRASTDEAESPIPPQATGEFKLYAIGKGSVLGTGAVYLRSQSGQTCTIDSVWAPVLEQRYYTWVVVVSLLLIILAHTALIVYRDRRHKSPDH